MDIAAAVAAFRARVDAATAAHGRAAGSVKILGVTKTQTRDAVLAAISAGLTDVGENYVQEAREKYRDLPAGVHTHFIGHVQTNKAKLIAGLFDVVQSIDRLEAGLAVANAARRLGKTPRMLIQVNISPTERFGVAPGEAQALAQRLRDEGVEVDGVMAIGPADGNVDAAFGVARATYERVGGSTLSLGMSDDWERAIGYGSTMIRIGSAIFGPRPAREGAVA